MLLRALVAGLALLLAACGGGGGGVARMLNLLFGDTYHPPAGNAEVIRIDL